MTQAAADKLVFPRVHKWTREEYHTIAQTGLFDDRRVELIDGEIIEMPPMLSPHATAIRNLHEALLGALTGQQFVYGIQMPIIVDENSEPEPDFYLAMGRSNDYAFEHPRVPNLILVAEVSESTFWEVRTRKGSLYARAGVEDYWIINLPERRLEIYRQPQEDATRPFGFGYASRLDVLETGSVSLLSFPTITIQVSDILPPQPSS